MNDTDRVAIERAQANARAMEDGDPLPETGVDPAGDVVYDEDRARPPVVASYLVRVVIRSADLDAGPTLGKITTAIRATVDDLIDRDGAVTVTAERVDR